MRHLYLYTQLLLAEANRQGRPVRLQWGQIATALIEPDPTVQRGLLITLPAVAAVGTEEDAVLLRALIAHEVLCHGHHTDFDVVPGVGIGGALENVLEDPRGELLAAKSYPGSRKVIREGIEVLVHRNVFTGPPTDKPVHPAEILTSWLVTELRSELLGQSCLDEMSLAWRKLAINTFGSKLTAAVKAESLKGTAAASTGDMQKHARRILELLKLAKDHPQPPQGGRGDPSAQRGTSGAGGDPQQGPGNQPGAGQQTPNVPDQGTPRDGEDKASPSQGQGGFEPDPKALANAINAVLSATKEDAGKMAKGLESQLVEGNRAMASGGAGHSHTHEMGEVSCPRSGSPEKRSEHRCAARTLTATLGLKLADLLEARDTVQRRKSEDGRLRSGRLWRVPLGDLKVFLKRTTQDELNTCVMLLADESGSMDTAFGSQCDPFVSPAARQAAKARGEEVRPQAMRRMHAAHRTCVAAGEVLNDAQVPFALAGFNTQVRFYKDFEYSWSDALQHFEPYNAGGTNTHLAVVWALGQLVDRKEDRKLLVVVLDGDPGDAEVLRAALSEAVSYGVEVLFVLITATEEHRYQAMRAPYGVAREPSELATAVFGALQAALV
ncbi:hypothetical protein [Rubrivivax gelatinosus]|uniref:hypothetical protein n=1 Tax=Rubrivivax gelatinosus TaxID=28068 RepID=UPI001A20077A|nr:hypothetical protein [Rubrivivax gelatinosus]MBG6082981.1 hypothetical protein [Rubrivivax gelatinosus]